MTSVDFDDVKVKYEEHSSCDQDDAGVYGSLSSEKADSPMTPSILKSSNNASTAIHVDEKKMRRAIANSNERRRMQSINAGFQSLRALLPHHEGEKLSKATVLQQTAEYIYALQQDKTRLLSQNCKLKRMLGHQQEDDEVALALTDLASSRKRKATTALSSSENEDLRMQLNRERALRIHLEQKLNSLQGIYNDKIEETDLTSEHVTIQYHPGELEELTNKVSPVIVEPILIRRDSHCSTTNLNSPDSNSSSSTSILLQPSAHTDSFISISHHGNIATADHHMQQQSPSPPTPSCTILQQQQNIEIEKPDNVKLVESLPSPTSISNSPSVPLTSAGSTTVMSANSPGANHIENDHILNSRLYISSASRPNLETIVEAIRHLEGDSMFFDKVAQDTPLALTTTKHASPDFFHRSSHQQQRPGVIVVKPN